MGLEVIHLGTERSDLSKHGGEEVTRVISANASQPGAIIGGLALTTPLSVSIVVERCKQQVPDISLSLARPPPAVRPSLAVPIITSGPVRVMSIIIVPTAGMGCVL